MTLQPYNHELRLQRALQHLQSLEAEVQRWLGPNAYGFIEEFDVQRSENVIRAIAIERPPANFGLIIGDCLHNLRAALDNLVYDLGVAYSRGNVLPSDIEGKLMFPIFKDRKEFKRRGADRIRGIDPRAQAIIKDLQPYKRGDEYASDPLWELHELSNIDKHRLVHLTLLGYQQSVFGGYHNVVVEDVTRGSGIVELPGSSSPIRGTELISYRATPIDPRDKMRVYFNIRFGISFDKESPVPSESVLITLERLRNYILDNVVSLLIPYLTRMHIVHVSQPYSLLPSRG